MVRGSNPNEGETIRTRATPALGPIQPPTEYVPDLFQGEKRPWHNVNHPSTAEVKERVELYFYSPSRPSWPVLRQFFFLNRRINSQNLHRFVPNFSVIT